MNLLKEADLRRKIKADPTGAYFFFGEEDYMKVAAISTARDAVLHANGDSVGDCFNDIRLGGTDFTADALADAANSPPMMGERKIITVTGLRIDDMKAADFEDLCATLSELSRPELDYNLLIISVDSDAFDYGTLPKRPSAKLTALCEHLTPVYFERNTPARLAAWVDKHYQHGGVTADAQVCAFTVDWCGRDMYKLASEIHKVASYVRAKGREAVTVDDVKLVAIPAVEYDAFAFTNAIMEHRRDLALNILADLKFRREEPIIILSEVNRVLCDLLSVKVMADDGATVGEVAEALRMHEYKAGLYLRQAKDMELSRLKAAVRSCDDADKALKLSAKGYAVIEKLICSL
ncbi:MAG: DNA polymerase III subunit delta [Ruminococcaceae bacterium]|nr:DNA polymerase III subunit delta [Oscillospiraceae bacterium]